MHRAVAQFDGFGVRLQKVRADRLREARHLTRGGRDGPSRHDGAPRAPAAGRVGRVFRVAMDKFDLGDVNPQNLMSDLGESRLHALPMRVDTDPELETSVGRHARGRLLVSRHHWNAPSGIDRGPVRALLAIDRKTNADEASVRLAAPLALTNALEVGRI